VRYSSSRRFQAQEDDVPVFVSPKDFLGKRTALFGMTPTGKSNTVMKIIQASVLMSGNAPHNLAKPPKKSAARALEPFTPDGVPKYLAGQIIFDRASSTRPWCRTQFERPERLFSMMI
jgi:hypothetical protein